VARLVGGLIVVPLAAITAITAAAGINFGYPVQPVWLFFAVLGFVSTLIAAAVCLGRDLRRSPVGWLAGVTLIALSLGLVVVVVGAPPSKRAARVAGLRRLALVTAYPGARIVGYHLDSVAAGDWGPSYLHPADSYSVSRTEVLPLQASPQEAVAYYRGLLRRFGRVSINRPARDAEPPDPAAPLVELVSGGAVPAYGVAISRQDRRLLATTAYSG
jgi:hypothetical protein